jgi:dynein heavy chain
MEPERVVGTDAQMHAWLMALPALIKQHQRRLAELLQGLVPPLLAFVRKTSREFMATLDNSLVASTLNLLSTFWTPFLAVEGIYTPSPDMLAALPLILERAVVFSVVWGIGASSDSTSRRAFDVALRARVTELHLDAAVALPDLGLAYDYAINLEPCESSEAGAVPSRPFGGFVGWMQTVPELQLLPKVAFHDIIVPTSDTVRYAWLLEALLTHGRHMLAVGPTGTGKTLNVANKLLTAMPSRFLPLFVGFSAQTSANATQDQIDAKLDKRRKGIFGPPAGKKYAVFVDDANMPKREEYGAQPPVELLRQSLGQGGWYDRKTHEFRTIVDVSYVAVMGPPGGGRHAVTNRFLRYFHCVAFPELDDASMRQIFGAILRTFATAYLPEQLLDCCTPIINAAIDLYKTLLRELLPTPAKPHYTFNLRDLASVVQGLLSADPKTTKTSADLTRLWLHESMRVFRDRLICADDRTWFDGTLRSLVSLHLGAWEDAIAVEPGHLFYGDFMSPGVEPKVYIEITDIEKMGRVVEECLEDYNAVNTKRMPLVIFVDAVAHVARISRVLRQPRGNALLLGVGGSGRQSLTQLAAAMADYEIFQIEISKSYGLAEWREDLKKTLLIAGEDGKNVVLLFTDTQVLYESFLEDVNSLLNAGDVPNLLDENDTNEIVASMRPLAQAAGQPLTKVALYNFFVKRVRAKLHLVICMSPASEAFSRRLRSFPSLVNNCTIDFFSEWPQEALKSVASSALECAELGREHDAVISCIGKVHQSVEAASIRFLAEQRRYNYVTPTSYLEVLSTFNSLLALKRKEVSTAKRRLETGLHKLQTTEVEVEALKQQIEEMQPLLIRTCEEVEVMMGQIRVDSAEADATRAAVARDEEVASQKAAECQQIKDSAEKDLAEALPALDAAVAVLRNLKLSDLSEVAKYANPPAGVKLVTEAMCVLKGVPAKMVGSVGQKTADYWEPGKKMLSDAKGLLESMFTFDKDNIPEKIIVKLQPYITNPDFAPDKIESISKACTAMCQWVLAMNKYHFVALEVEPKRKALISAEEELDLLTWSLTQLRDGLQEVQIKIQGLEAKYNASVAQKEELAARLADATVKQDRAARLLGGLGGEKVRWRGTVASLKQAEANIIGDVCVAASAVAYSGPFTSEYRLSLAKCWRKHLLELGIQHSEGASVSRVMADPVRVRRWQEHGLPADTVSTENGLILANARRWPLSIDPQAQANKWIRSMEAEQQLAVCKPSDTDFVRTLENAVRFGKPVLFENVLSTLDPALEPILLKQTYKQGGSDVMKIGDAIIPYHPDFKFYLTSKLSNPHYAPEASVKVALLNFTVTSEGLEDQLLGLTVAKERPDLEESKSKLVVSSAQMAYQLNDIGSTILRLLSESSGDILDDEDLISTLSQSKVMSDEISAKAAEAAATEKEIDQTRDQYRPVAVRAALLFFCVADMAKVDPMYQYSINWFTTLFVRSIEEAPQSQDIAQRLQSLSDHFTHLLYENICRSLFEAHKLLFSFCAAVSILRGSGHVNANEWRFLITGSSLDRVDEPNPDPSWLTPAVWSLLTSLATLPAFAGIHASVRDALADWRSYFESSQTHLSPLPGEWDVQLGEMQKLCVLRCVRPDKVVPGMQLFVRNLLGQRFVETPAFDLSTSFRDSTNVLPIVFVLSPGADPADSLLKFAAEAKMGKKLTSISLGQGQGPIAERHMAYAVQTGLWVLLQNCHLAASWMPRLEAIVEQYVAEETHKDYRLWLTSMPSSQFPVSILQNSVKITIEPPRGIKMNMIGSYAAFTDKILNGHPKYDAYKRLLYGLSFFHALLQDRRKFGPLGFNVSYEFTTGDLQCCMLQLETFLARYDEVPFAMLVHLFGHINYGGRITDDFDRRMVMTVLKSVMNEGLLKDGFQLAPGEHYRAPPAGQVSDYRAAIGELPVTPHPNVFGLNENADISCAQAETSTLCDILVALQPKVSSGAGRDRDEAVAELATALLERRLEPFPLEVITLRYPLRYDESMNTVLTQECIRYNKLIVAFNCTLSDLLKALKGVVVMSSELEAMAHALYSNQVPALWTAISYPSLKPLVAWVDDLVQRIAFVKSWVDEGPPPLFWISGFYFPQAFLTGTLQNYARRESVAIDTVSFAYIVLLAEDESASDKPETGCYISGLFLEGAGWDTSRKVLVESRPKQLFLAFPPIWLKPTVDRALPTKKVYSCPVYKTLTRAGTLSTTGHSTNFVLAIELPSDQLCEGVFSRYAEGFSPLWIKRAVALFCALNY